MRAAAILGLGCSLNQLKSFQADHPLVEKIEWQIGMPASHDQADVILVFGGDGTVHRHLGQLVRLSLPVLVVPAGSGNDFARALGLRRVGDALAAWQKFASGAGNVRTIDLGTISSRDETSGPPITRYFCCVAGVGLDGEVSRRASQLPRWLRGHGGYALSLVPTIFSFAPKPIKILTRDEFSGERTAELRSAGRPGAAVPTCTDWTTRSDQPTLLAAFANTPAYGGGMRIAPQAKMDDGLLDICVVGEVDPFKLFCMFPSVYYGRHLKVREVEYLQAERVRVETEHPLDVYADGEYVCRTPIEVAVQASALKVITP